MYRSDVVRKDVNATVATMKTQRTVRFVVWSGRRRLGAESNTSFSTALLGEEASFVHDHRFNCHRGSLFTHRPTVRFDIPSGRK